MSAPLGFDVRQHEVRLHPDQLDQAQHLAAEVSAALPGEHHLVVDSLDERSGVADLIRSEGAPPAGPDLTTAAVEHLKQLRPVLGLTAAPTVTFQGAPTPVTTSSGAAVVHLQQRVSDIPVFQAVRQVVFAPDHTIRSTGGLSFIPTPDASTEPALTASDAVLVAAQHLASTANGPQDPGDPPEVLMDLTGFTADTIAVSSTAREPDQGTTLTAKPFDGPVEARLLWFDVASELRLAWEVLLGVFGGYEHYRVIVDAQTGTVLYRQSTTLHVLARGNVAVPNPDSPRQMRPFPLPLSAYPVPRATGLTVPFPRDWVKNNRTDGDNAWATLAADVGFGPDAVATLVDGVVTFDPADGTGDDQRRVTAFYLCNYMHDLLYLLGFREGDGNFQTGGAGFNDYVAVVVHPTPLPNGSFMDVSAQDSVMPTMHLDVFALLIGRHTALDASVVLHEYGHGLTTRLVGGYHRLASANMANIQSASLGEGWSDYLSCTLTGSTVVGSWVSRQPGGVRGFAYDEAFPDHYGALGTGRYNEVHNNGEIWCAALMELQRWIGVPMTLQLVVDGLKLTPANPTYLQARDAMLSALRDMSLAQHWERSFERTTTRHAWRAFAKFGMGANALAGSSLNYSGVRADFTVPDYPATIYAITEAMINPVTNKTTVNGDLLWYRHDGRSNATGNWATVPDRVGHGWNFAEVFGGGEGVIYAITERTVNGQTQEFEGGDLLWYRHDGWPDGNKDAWTSRRTPLSPHWWQAHVFSGGDGILYSIADNGDLTWMRHVGWRDGSREWTKPADMRIGNGWGDFADVFSAGSGVIYAVTKRTFDADGDPKGPDLVWYRHDGWRTGRNQWAPQGSRIVRSGWDAVQTFSGGDGIIYARRADGSLIWYRHDGWHDGSNNWGPGSGQQVGTGWFFKNTFASS